MTQSQFRFDRLPAQMHSPTSIAAAEAVEPNAGTQRAKVLARLRWIAQGLTDEELQEQIPMAASTERPRRIELVQRGLVRDSGRTRKTRSGRQAVVWEAVQ